MRQIFPDLSIIGRPQDTLEQSWGSNIQAPRHNQKEPNDPLPMYWGQTTQNNRRSPVFKAQLIRAGLVSQGGPKTEKAPLTKGLVLIYYFAQQKQFKLNQ